MGVADLGAIALAALHLARAGARQVKGRKGNGPKVGYTHVYGAPGVSAVTILSV